MDWGKGVVFICGGFVTIMVSMVIICMKQDTLHLVTPNYYEEEIKYQGKIDMISNAETLGIEMLEFNSKAKTIEIKIPEGSQGTLLLFRPSDARMDKKIEISDINSKLIDVSSLAAGYWRIKLHWTAGGIAYYQEQKITI